MFILPSHTGGHIPSSWIVLCQLCFCYEQSLINENNFSIFWIRARQAPEHKLDASVYTPTPRAKSPQADASVFSPTPRAKSPQADASVYTPTPRAKSPQADGTEQGETCNAASHRTNNRYTTRQPYRHGYQTAPCRLTHWEGARWGQGEGRRGRGGGGG